MSKKKIDPTSVLNELRESSSFFRPVQTVSPPTLPSPLPSSEKKVRSEPPKKADVSVKQPQSTVHPREEVVVEKLPSPPLSAATTPPDTHTTTPPRHRDTKGDTVIPRYHDSVLETTRRSVKQLGKEAATHRFTAEEKKALKSVERDYEDKNIRTSENEITRIAINYVIEEYRTNGKNSILARVLDLLHS